MARETIESTQKINGVIYQFVSRFGEFGLKEFAWKYPDGSLHAYLPPVTPTVGEKVDSNAKEVDWGKLLLTDEEILRASEVETLNSDGSVNLGENGYLTGRKQVSKAQLSKVRQAMEGK